jgi:hypothetical protein
MVLESLLARVIYNIIMKYLKPIQEAKSIQDLSPREERPIVEGIAAILRKVHDIENRREIAKSQIREFKRDGIRFDYAQFLKLFGL